jgi:ParB-like chromosome segregation protein Spo0J
MKTTAKRKRTGQNRTSPKTIVMRSVWSIYTARENDKLYRPVREDDPDIIALAESIAEHGVREPIVVTQDAWVLSGHRRLCAARLARLKEVPCRIEPFRKEDDPDRFLRLLREYNRQRDKTADEKLREELVTVNADHAYQSLIEHREEQAKVAAPAFTIVGEKRRSEITAAKRPMLTAILNVVQERRDFWPLSDRQIHYALLNDPPLKHASKPDSGYANDLASYKALTELLTRARLAGEIGWECIADETRPVVLWDVHQDCRGFIRREIDGFLKGYWRDLTQSQPNHVEILGEKNTLLSVLRPVAAEYCIPLTVGRGFSSLPPRHAMHGRYRQSGKSKLVLLIVSDFDPDGEEIAQSFARSMRDDFGVVNIHPVKVALTAEQVERFKLRPMMQAKETSANHAKFVERHSNNVFEVEALPPAVLQAELRTAIDAVIDVAAFNAELEREKQDAACLAGVRNTVRNALQGSKLDETDLT